MQKFRVTKFCTVAPGIFSIVTAVFSRTYQTKYQFMCTEWKAPDIELQRSCVNCGSSVWNLLHVTLRHQEFGGST